MTRAVRLRHLAHRARTCATCGATLPAPLRGRHSGHWIATCGACFVSRVVEAPDVEEDDGPDGLPFEAPIWMTAKLRALFREDH